MVRRSNAKNTKNLWALTRPYDRCLVLLDWISIVAVFQSSRAICHRDTVGNALSRTKRRPTLVSPSRSYSTTLKYLPCSVEVYVYLPTWTRRFQMKTFPIEPVSPICITKTLTNISLMQAEGNIKGRL